MVYRPTARVLSLLELLQNYGQMTGVELARRLEVDTRTVRRYVTTLQDMGVPIESEPGRYGGYMLRPGFKLPPLMFTDDEVLMLALGLRLARRSGVSGAGAAVESALAKIERVLPIRLGEQVRALQDPQILDEQQGEVHRVEGGFVATLTLASRQQRRVRLVYGNEDGQTERVIDPYGVVYFAHARWYVVGYCHLRESIRTFRLDRVLAADLLDSTFTPPENFDALAYLIASNEAIPDQWNIDVLLTMPLTELRQRLTPGLATLTPEGERVRFKASLHNLDFTARILIGLGCPVEIVNPPELRETFAQIAAELVRVAGGAG